MPSASGVEGGGTAVNSTYGVLAYPTICVIAPNKTFVTKDLWPISSVSTINSELEAAGASQNDCSTGISDNICNASIVSVFPNPSTGNTFVKVDIQENTEILVEVFNVVGGKVLSNNYGVLSNGSHTLELNTTGLSSGIYAINIKAGDAVFTRKLSVQ